LLKAKATKSTFSLRKTDMKLFKPFKLKGLLLRNRIVMSSMGTNLADREGFVTDEMVAYYGERAKAGAGLIMTELVTVEFPRGNGIERQLSISDDKYMPGLSRLTSQIHQYGSKIFVQLNHAGNRTKPDPAGKSILVSASNIPSSVMNVEPRPLTLEEIEGLIETFGQAARRAKETGFDGVDLHLAHGYLLCQFLSRITNKRSDEYGGSLGNRARFIIEILERCRQEVGDDFVISAKIAGNQYVDGGITPSEAKALCCLLEKRGIDAIQVSGGDPESATNSTVPPMYSRRGCYVKLAESVKKAVNIPVIAVGRINNVQLANLILEGGKADLIAMGRAFLADPSFPTKAQKGNLEEIRLCIGCNQGCSGRDRTKYLVVGCVLNPRAGREKDELDVVPARVSKKILVVGGGPGGMEAARVAALRKHHVTLVENRKALGGQLQVAARPPGRGEFHHLINWYRIQLMKLGVKLLLGRCATPDLIQDLGPDVVILATGSSPLVPQIEGVRPESLAPASDVLGKRIETGQKVVIIGGGGVGLDVADFLAVRGKKVMVVEQLPDVGRDLEVATKKVLMGRLARGGVEILKGVTIHRVESKKIVVQWNGDKREITFDKPLVNATGAKGNSELSHSLKEIKELKDVELYEIGDCVSPRQLRDAILEGWQIGKVI
jgi:2,4-dienoyl-CoA reductase-like NADH-dependent reductase (Old Yellow Enzyme family)